MHFGLKLWQRILVRLAGLAFALAALAVVFFTIFPFFGSFSTSTYILPLAYTYLAATYLVFPLFVRLFNFVTRRKRVPRYTSTGDGLPADPANIVLVGSQKAIKKAFKMADWHEADTLTFRSSWKMAKSFLANTPYASAPFSNLYLFGRPQDHGFQKPIGGSPRKRHHVRFWAFNTDKLLDVELSTAFWHSDDAVNRMNANVWVGAATKDTGFGLTRMTFQISHAVDKDTVAERDFLVSELKKSGLVSKTSLLKPDTELPVRGKVNPFITDGTLAVVYLHE